MTLKRGFNSQEAMAYLGVRRKAFEKHFKPHLNGTRFGTAIVYDRVDLDRVLEEHKARNGRPVEKGEKSWADRMSPVSTGGKTAAGLSTRCTVVTDFLAAASKAMAKRKAGS